jgi:hypothetical protein
MKTPRFFQYRGRFPAESGLDTPRMTVQVWTSGGSAPTTLKVGRPLKESQAFATNAAGPEGPVFALPTGPAWDDLIRTPLRAGDLPDDVFAPAAGPGAGEPRG